MAKKKSTKPVAKAAPEVPDDRFTLAFKDDDEDEEVLDNDAEEAMDEESVDDNNDKPTEDPAKTLIKPLIKKKKHGIIYISSIPKYMTVSILREFLSEHADIGRIYLQANGPKKDDGKRNKITLQMSIL